MFLCFSKDQSDLLQLRSYSPLGYPKGSYCIYGKMTPAHSLFVVQADNQLGIIWRCLALCEDTDNDG